MRHVLFLLVLLLLLGGMLSIARAGDDGAVPPKDAMWTINCRSFTGPYRVEAAKRTREAVIKLTGWKNWYILHQEDESTLFYGSYKASPSRDVEGGDPKEAEKARQDLKNIKALRDVDGNPVFPFSYPTEIPRPGSEGPSEYDIKNTPADRYWSLIIGEYRDNPERKKAAVDAVKMLRAEKIEAYYLHGPLSSLVCVGAWPKSAMKSQDTDAAEPDDPNTVVKVYNVPLPKNAITDYVDKNDGKHYKLYAPKVEIVDPGMKLAVDKNPYFATNGEVFGKRMKDRKGKERVVPNPSQLLIIPHKGSTFGGASEDAAAPAPNPVRPMTPSKPKEQPGTGKLKSLD